MVDEMRLLKLDASEFSACFPDRQFRIGHNLADHPLFEIERLLLLASSLPERLVEYNAGNLSVHQDPELTPRNGLSIKDTVRRIDECNSWMVLKCVEHDPEYRALLNACIDEVRPCGDVCSGGLHQCEAYVFLSSPNAVTPYHNDDEHNFLLQIRGEKTVHTWDPRDPDVLSHIDLERSYTGGHRNLVFREELNEFDSAFDLRPGDGLHIPVNSPHWVQNGPTISISFSVTFRTAKLHREETIHWFNGHLRKRGFSPSPYARSAIGDALKYPVARVTRSAIRALRRRKGS